jgi:PAS domain S-box-containing protein
MTGSRIGVSEYQVLESIPDALLIVDQAGAIVFANDGVGRLFGYAGEELIGHSLNELLPERFRRTHEQKFADYAKDPYVRPMGGGAIFHARRKSGEEFPVEINLSPLNTADELLVMAAIRDVSARVKLEGELRRSRDELDDRVRARTSELEEAARRLLSEREETARTSARVRQMQEELSHLSRLSTIGEMAAGLGHEINQPLASIVNYAQGCIRRIESDTGEPDQLIDAFQRISREAARGSEIIGRFRRFARKQELNRQWVNTDGLLFDALRLMEPDVAKHGIAMDLRVSGLLPQVYVDPIQLQQVVVNLLRNAVEAVMGEQEDNRHVTLQAGRPRGDAIEIAVIDTGHGLKAESVDRLFDTFFTTKSDGLGMGLSLSRRIVEAHGGELSAQANNDRGMTFCVLLPVSEG